MSPVTGGLARLTGAVLTVAAQRRSIVTYKELSAAINLIGVLLNTSPVLARTSEQCPVERTAALAAQIRQRAERHATTWLGRRHQLWRAHAQHAMPSLMQSRSVRP